MTERKRAEITGASVWRVVCEKKIARKRGTDEGCHRIPRIYERKQGTRNRMAAGGHMEGRETPERKSQRAGRGGKMRKRDRGTPGEAREEENVRAVGYGRGRDGRTREWSEIVQLSASERKRVGAMCVGHVERACVLGSPVCLPPFPTIRPPRLSANVILRLSLSSLSSSLSLSLRLYISLFLSYSRSNRGASIPRPRIPCTPHRSQEGSLRSQPTRRQADTPL